MTKKVRDTPKSAVVVRADKKPARGGESYIVHTSTGTFRVRASASSIRIMDETIKRYAKAMKRLTKR
jgi:deoxyribose-phosphate aldolase